MGHYHDPQGRYDYCDDTRCPRTSDRLPNGLLRSVTPWSAEEELAREQAEADIELAHEAEQERQQILHDEMIDDMLARDGRFG